MNDRRGQALVEFALILPLLLLVLLAIISYGLFINADVTVQQAARIGARSAALGNPLGCPGDLASRQQQQGQPLTIYGLVDDQINLGLNMSIMHNGSAYPVLTTPGTTPPSSAVTESTDPKDPAQEYVTVTVTYPYSPVVPLPGLLPAHLLLHQSYTMMVQTPEPATALMPSASPGTNQVIQPGVCP